MNDALKLLLGNQEGTEIEIVKYMPLTYNMKVVYSYIDRSYYGEEQIKYGKKYFRNRDICNEILKCMTKDYFRIQTYNVNSTLNEISEKLDKTLYIRKEFPGSIFINFEIIYNKSCISLHIPTSGLYEFYRDSYYYTDGENIKLLDKNKLIFSPRFLEAMSEGENNVPKGIRKFLQDADLEELFEQQLLIHEIGEN